VVTSRSQLCGLLADGAHSLRLDLLTSAEAGDLLAGRLGRHRTAAEPAAVEEIIVSCARLPLALAIAAARAAARPDFPLADCAAALRDSSGLDAFGSDTTNVRTVFQRSYRTLGADAARLFRLLGLHPGPDLTTAGAASLAGESLAWARSALAELERAHLVVAHARGRHTLRDLLRAYAAELTAEHDGEDGRREALGRVLDYYLHTAMAADRIAQARRAISSIPIDPPRPGVTLESLAGQAEALAWLAAETRAMVTTLHQADDAAFDSRV
jgi:hypothetical protein